MQCENEKENENMQNKVGLTRIGNQIGPGIPGPKELCTML